MTPLNTSPTDLLRDTFQSSQHIEGIKVLASKWDAFLPGDTIRLLLDYKLELLFRHFEFWIQV